MTDAPDDSRGWESVPGADTLRGDRALPAVMTAGPTASAPGHASGRPRRGLRKGAVIGIVAGAAALVLLVVAGGIGWSVGSDSHSADRPVQAFLQDVEGGRLTDALDAAGIDRDDDDVLLTDAAYAQANDKITAHRIT